MARGWESKEVESQIEAAAERAVRVKLPQPSAEQIAHDRARESLELSRTRVLEDLATAANPKYRIILQRSLEFLDAKLAELDRR